MKNNYVVFESRKFLHASPIDTVLARNIGAIKLLDLLYVKIRKMFKICQDIEPMLFVSVRLFKPRVYEALRNLTILLCSSCCDFIIYSVIIARYCRYWLRSRWSVIVSTIYIVCINVMHTSIPEYFYKTLDTQSCLRYENSVRDP